MVCCVLSRRAEIDAGIPVTNGSLTCVAGVNVLRADDGIRSRSTPTCYLCKATGTLLYKGLKDRAFGAPGTWNLKRCPNPSCGLIWLDPMPTELDIAKAYERYFTHGGMDQTGSREARIQKAKTSLASLYQSCWRLTPLYSEQQELDLMYLRGRRPGSVLEVGCGDGQRLAQLRARGWDVQGLEVDERAAAQAQSVFGVPVYLGSLDQAAFRDEEFDVVAMNHVLEHVHDPLRLLGECKRVLKPGGLLVSITPNTQGWVHRRFGACWYGLDPPRHLFLFSRKTLEQVARKCDFREVRTWTTAARSVWMVAGSLRIQCGEILSWDIWPAIKRAIRQPTLHAAAIIARYRDPEAGDECVLYASK
jgi:SAM-dependent methyltransferase